MNASFRAEESAAPNAESGFGTTTKERPQAPMSKGSYARWQNCQPQTVSGFSAHLCCRRRLGRTGPDQYNSMPDLCFIARRSCETAQFFRQQASKSYGRSVLPVRTHNLNPYRQPGFCLTDGCNRSWAPCERSWGSPVGHVEVGFGTARGEDGALVLRFGMVMLEGSREGHRR